MATTGQIRRTGMRLDPDSAHNRLYDAQRLAEDFPLTTAALADGRITAQQARAAHDVPGPCHDGVLSDSVRENNAREAPTREVSGAEHR